MDSKQLKLLPHQYELVLDKETKILGLCSGVGGGKTFAACQKACVLLLDNIGYDGIISEPNYPLLVQILIPEMKKALDFFGIPYRFSSSDTIFYCNVGGIETRIICKSLESVDRLIGINAAWCIMDEFDTAKTDIAYNAYLKLLARIRVGNVRQMVITSTPEGFKAMYRIFVTEANSGNKRLIKAKTLDNKYLDPDYVATLLSIYSSSLVAAYLEGEFVNLTSGSVYHEFDRALNYCNTEISTNEPLHIGMDFNVGKMAAVVYVLRETNPHAVSELTDVFDTPTMAALIKRNYPNHAIYVYPDASGNARKSQNASESDLSILRQAGFTVLVNSRNPAVKDRILATNAMIHNQGIRKYFVNTDKCPALTESLEKQAYDKNGDPDKSSGLDHVIDAATYFIAYKFPILTQTRRIQIQI